MKNNKKSICCGADMLLSDDTPVQCECCGADGREFPTDKELLNEKLRDEYEQEMIEQAQ